MITVKIKFHLLNGQIPEAWSVWFNFVYMYNTIMYFNLFVGNILKCSKNINLPHRKLMIAKHCNNYYIL